MSSELTKKDKKFLNALAIGDGHIRQRGNSFAICIKHSDRQKDYLEFKAKRLSDILKREVNVRKFNNSGYGAYGIEVTIPYMKFVRKWLYRNGLKRLNISFLRRLSDEGVAIWYMDDGSLIRKKRNGKIHASELILSICCTEKEANDCILFFKGKYDVYFSLKRNKGLFSIRCGTKNAHKLLDRIEKYIIPSMKYKTFRMADPPLAERDSPDHKSVKTER